MNQCTKLIEFKSDIMLALSCKSNNYMGSNREKSNITIAVLEKLTLIFNPICRLKGLGEQNMKTCCFSREGKKSPTTS